MLLVVIQLTNDQFRSFLYQNLEHIFKDSTIIINYLLYQSIFIANILILHLKANINNSTK